MGLSLVIDAERFPLPLLLHGVLHGSGASARRRPRPLRTCTASSSGTTQARPEALADRWVHELDANGVRRAALIASVPGDEASVAAAVARHPSRLVGFFMLDPAAIDALARARPRACEQGLRGLCLFPAMHHVPSARRPDASRRRGRGSNSRCGRVRALRRSLRRRSSEAGAAKPLRPAPRRSARGFAARADVPANRRSSCRISAPDCCARRSWPRTPAPTSISTRRARTAGFVIRRV